MREIIAVIIGFGFIPILTKRKIPISYSILTSAFIMILISGLGIDSIIEIVSSTILDPKKVGQYLTVVEIGVLGTLLKKYGFIQIIIDKLNRVVSNKKLQLMFVPALIGLLAVPGGAIISAPFIDKIGEDLDIVKSKRAVINLVYRHISMHVMPYSNGLLLMALLLPQISVYRVIAFNLIFVLIYVMIGYLTYIKDIKYPATKKDPISVEDFLQLALYTAPIYFAVILNIAFNIPFFIGVLFNILILYLLRPRKTIIKDFFNSINLNVFLTILGVYLIQGTISNFPEFNRILASLLSNPSTLIISIVGISVFFGLATGFQPASLGVIIPVIGSMALSLSRMTVLAHIVFAWSFVGYFFSPLHLCQLFTVEYMKVKNSEVYKMYFKFIVLLVIALLIENIILLSLIK